MEPYPAQGSTTVALDVLLTIAQLTAINVKGVSRFSHIQASNVNRLFKPGHYRDGVRVEIVDDVVNVDLFLILKDEYNVREVSHNIQREVTRAISEMVGMPVGHVNIHIEDIDISAYGESETP